jgi:DNA ligase-1
MKNFSELLEKLVFTASRNKKLEIMAKFFRETPDPDRGYALAAMTRDLDIKNLKASALKEITIRHVDPVLFQYSYNYVGDLGETISLIWPYQEEGELPSITDFIAEMNRLPKKDIPERMDYYLTIANPSERWAMIKMLTGGLRIGVSSRLAKTALALYASQNSVIPAKAGILAQKDPSFRQDDKINTKDDKSVETYLQEIEKIWHGLDIPYLNLFAWLDGKAEKPEINHAQTFHPMMLSHPIDEEKDFDVLRKDDFQAEWKWDGIRVQLVFDEEEKKIFSRTGDDISAAFPDILDNINGSAVLDGELLVGHNFEPMPFNNLQQRLNRKSVIKKHLLDYPAYISVYDMLFDGKDDIRALSLSERRERLENWMAANPSTRLDLSEIIPIKSWQDLEEIRIKGAEEQGHEGIMIKLKSSAYEAGRPKGKWYKWKRDARLLDCVMMYAQRGHGKRSSFYSDYTFGVWKGNEIVPVGKAYSGFTDEELKELDKWVRKNTIERFGPVCEVKKELVCELAFDSMHESPRHKSGVAMRFPRINRIRWDKPVGEIDTLEGVKKQFL